MTFSPNIKNIAGTARAILETIGDASVRLLALLLWAIPVASMQSVLLSSGAHIIPYNLMSHIYLALL